MRNLFFSTFELNVVYWVITTPGISAVLTFNNVLCMMFIVLCMMFIGQSMFQHLNSLQWHSKILNSLWQISTHAQGVHYDHSPYTCSTELICLQHEAFTTSSGMLSSAGLNCTQSVLTGHMHMSPHSNQAPLHGPWLFLANPM